MLFSSSSSSFIAASFFFLLPQLTIVKGANLFLLSNAGKTGLPRKYSSTVDYNYGAASTYNNRQSFSPKKKRTNPSIKRKVDHSTFETMAAFYGSLVEYIHKHSPKMTKKIHPSSSLNRKNSDDTHNSDEDADVWSGDEKKNVEDGGPIKAKSRSLDGGGGGVDDDEIENYIPPPPPTSILHYDDFHRFKVIGKNAIRCERENDIKRMAAKKSKGLRQSIQIQQIPPYKSGKNVEKSGFYTKRQLRTFLMYKLGELRSFYGTKGKNGSYINVLHVVMEKIEHKGITIPKKIERLISKAYDDLLKVK